MRHDGADATRPPHRSSAAGAIQARPPPYENAPPRGGALFVRVQQAYIAVPPPPKRTPSVIGTKFVLEPSVKTLWKRPSTKIEALPMPMLKPAPPLMPNLVSESSSKSSKFALKLYTPAPAMMYGWNFESGDV